MGKKKKPKKKKPVINGPVFYQTYPANERISCFKVVTVEDDHRYSSTAKDALRQEYTVGEFTLALQEAYDLGYGVMAFETFEQAQAFADTLDASTEIWEATCYGRLSRRPLSLLKGYDWTLESLHHFSFAKAETCWEEGTIVARAIRLDTKKGDQK